MSVLTNNSIGWANVQITGGWSRIAWVCGAIAIGLPLLLFGSMRISEQPDATLAWWYHALSIVQGILFGIVIPTRVHGAIKRDRMNKLIESHRLMPESSAAAVAGYIFGPNLLLLAAMACVFVIGLFIASAANQDWRGWIALHAAGGGISFMMCCLVAFTTQWLPRFNPALFGFAFGPMAIGAGTIVPALRVMFSPYSSGFAALQMGEIKAIHIIAFASQFTLAVILFVGACRRYRRDDVPPLGFAWGFALLTLWVVLSCVGSLGERVWIIGPLNSDQVIGISYIIGVSTSMLLAVGPISSAAGAVARWRERRKIDAYFIDNHPLPLPLASLMVFVLLLSLLAAAPLTVGALSGWSTHGTPRQLIHFLLTALVIAVFVLSVALLAFAAGRMKIPTAYLFIPWLIVFWTLLPIIDASTAAMQGEIDAFPRLLSSASAPFCLGLIWKDEMSSALVGVVAQAAVIPLQIIFWNTIKRFNDRKRIPAAA